MGSTYFLEIPIYRKSLDNFNEEWDGKHQAWVNSKHYIPELDEKRPPLYPYGWYYNETVGWLRLYCDFANQILGHAFVVQYERIPPIMKCKQFEPSITGTPLDVYVDLALNDEQIFSLVEKALLRLDLGDTFEGSYVDLECFRNVGRFVKWNSLVRTLGTSRI